MGVAAVVTYDKKEERTDNFFPGASSSPRSFDDGYYGAVGNDAGGNLCVGSVTGGVCSPRIADNVTLFRGVDMYHNFANQVEISERERIGGNLTAQYDATDNLRLTFDALVSHEDHHFHNSSAVTDFSGGTLTNQVVVGGADTTETVAGHVRTVHVGGTGDGGNVPGRNRRRDRRGSPPNVSREYLRVPGGLEKRTFGCQLRRVDEQSGVP